MTTQEKIALFKFYFQGNPNVYGELMPSGRVGSIESQWRSIKHSYTDQDIQEHLLGTKCIGLYPIHESKVKFLCFDIDGQDGEHKGFITKILAVFEKLNILSRYYLIEDSGRGYHIWLFFYEFLDSAKVYKFGRIILELAGLVVNKDVELFPKQPQVSGGRLGNLVKLPLGRTPRANYKRCWFVNEGFEMVAQDKQWVLLRGTQPVSEYMINTITEKHSKVLIGKVNDKSKEQKHGNVIARSVFRHIYGYPCLRHYIKNGAPDGKRNNIALRVASHLCRNGFTKEAIYQTLLEWNTKRNKIPLEEDELQRTVNSAFTGNYNYGCTDSMLNEQCDRKNCLLKPLKIGGK